ncbi:MAG TPA: cupin domain-containing protein [Chloroflexota bacterium]|nr:cupin domain-containing protein [Chloroflexota bacterium]
MANPQPFIGHYSKLSDFRPGHFNPIGLAQSERMKVVLVCLEPGQSIPAHEPGVDMALVVLVGEGTLISGEREEPLRPGSIGFVPAGVRRGVKASTRMIALHTVSPPPTAQDHAQVAAQLKQAAPSR